MRHDELRAICQEVIEHRHDDGPHAEANRSGICIAMASIVPALLDELEALRLAARDAVSKIDECADGRINFRRDFADRLRAALQDEPSPALTCRADDYPAHWCGRVPRRIRMRKTARADAPFFPSDPPYTIAWMGRAYYAWVNSHGAVCAITEDGRHLGVKPDEFEVIEWHETRGEKP